MWAGGPAQPSPNLGDALESGFVWLRVRCNACKHTDVLDLRKLRRRATAELWVLEASLGCAKCRSILGYKPKAHIIALERDI
jgi:hypothetical protein